MVGPPPPSWEIDADGARAFELAPGLWQLRLPLAWPSIRSVNAYVIARDDGVILVDCGGAGADSCREGLESALRQAGFGVEDVRVLVGTHTHSDHIGLAGWVIERSGAEFWMHPSSGHFYDAIREPERIADARGRRSGQEGVPEAEIEQYRDVREETEGVLGAVEPDHPLIDGARIDSVLGPWEVLETPGHCPSHVCLLQRATGVLIVADLVSATFAPWFDYGYSLDPVAEYLGSLDRIEALGPFALSLPGHGRPLESLPAAIELHRAGIAERLAATHDAVAAGPAGAYEITRRVMGEPPDDGSFVWRMTEVSAYLKHLRLIGAVVRDQDSAGRFSHRLASAPVERIGAVAEQPATR
jgi:glyoxylase-like metal-dependent hydrolase (beta-lactamase superfamily II)